MLRFSLQVSYAQIAVFDARLDHPFNEWSDAHVAQGFAWRPGSVSFATLVTSGKALIEVVTGASVRPSHQNAAMRAIAVPFVTPEHGEIDIATVEAAVSITLEPGNYELIFMHGLGRDDTNIQLWIQLYFLPVTTTVCSRVLITDTQLAPPEKLVMHAKPA